MDREKLVDILVKKIYSLWENNNYSSEAMTKKTFDVVTETDLAFEKELIETIKENAPGVPILSEETLSDTLASGNYFTIDPIDGTWNYSHGVPIYGTQISLVEEDEPVLAVIYLPTFNYMFRALKGGGCYLNDEPVQVKNYPKERTIISVTDLRRVEADLGVQLRFSQLVTREYGRPRMCGCTSYDLAMVACGAYQGKVNYKYNLWDVLPGILLTREAGGYAELGRDYSLAASSEELAKKLIETLEEAKRTPL